MKEKILWTLIDLAVGLAPAKVKPMLRAIIDEMLVGGLQAMKDGDFSREEWRRLADAAYDVFGESINEELKKG